MARQKEFFVIAHNIRSLLNVGSIFRTADAFGVDKVYLTGYTGRPDNAIHRNKIGKTALGAENYVPWEYKKSAVRLIKDLRLSYSKITFAGLENNQVGANIIRLPAFQSKFPLVLILGEEVGGIGGKLIHCCDILLEIPMHGQKESLNVSVAFGIAAYQIANSK